MTNLRIVSHVFATSLPYCQILPYKFGKIIPLKSMTVIRITASQTATKWHGMPCRQVCAQVFAQSRCAAASHSFCWQDSQTLEPWWLYPWENSDRYACSSTHANLKDWLSYVHLHLEVFKRAKLYQICHGVVSALNIWHYGYHSPTSRQSSYVFHWHIVTVGSMLGAWCWRGEFMGSLTANFAGCIQQW